MSILRHFRQLAGILCFAAVALAGFTAAADNPQPARPNSDPTYQQLRNISLRGEAVSVNGLTLKRDAGTFHLRSGTVCFVTPVEGKVTGAIFVGDGNFVFSPPQLAEQKMLKLLTKEDEFSENFSHMVLRFTDGTYDEIKKTGSPGSGGCDASLLKDSQNATRHKLKDNLEARILEDVLSSEPGMFFLAFVHGKRYSDKELYMIDPHGMLDQVKFMTYDENKSGVWAAFPLSDANRTGQKRAQIHIERQQLDTTIEKNANLVGKAKTTLISQMNELHVVPLNLFHTLRVQSVTGENGIPLSFIQEDKNEDAQFFVILPKPLALRETYTITTVYAGKEAVSNEGGENYYPLARHNWYPNIRGAQFGDYTSYDLTFRIPKGMKMAATGNLVSESNESGENVTVWKSGVPLTVAGFNFGKFKGEEAKLDRPAYTIQAYANEELPDKVKAILHTAEGNDLQRGPTAFGLPTARPEVALGTMTTTGMIKKALAEAALSVQLYTDYFGPTPFTRLAITQQTAFNYGQSWPGLVWLPITYFYDSTIRHQLGYSEAHAYFRVVAPHEVAHQWWGHTVGFNSYRDQWMSEGFSDMSASLYLQNVYSKEPQRFIQFWNEEREMLLERDKEGFRAIDAGPVTMGYRMSNTRTGEDLTRRLIYPKGAYILHMIRMMMWDRQTGDKNFKETMQEFVKTYSGQSATTEDFKAMVEKHMTPDMNSMGKGKMDWFFDEYVYGTALPSYKFEYAFDKDATGNVLFSFKLTQSNVDDRFRMLVPIYLELADGRMVTLGRARLAGNTTVEEKVPINGPKDKPKRALVNYFDDVLASPD